MPTPSLLIVPARFKTGKLYSQIPTSGAGDFTVTRNTEARRFDSAGLVASVASGIPRLDYFTSGGVTGCPALLVEPAATNLVLRSEEFNVSGTWSRVSGGTGLLPVITANAVVAPDGTTTADTVVFDRNAVSGSANFSQLQQSVNFPTSGTYTFGVYAKATTSGDVGKQFYIRTRNTLVSGSLTSSWVRYTSTETGLSSGVNTVFIGNRGGFTADQSVSVDLWGAQLETGSVATSYIPTTTGTGSRSADVVSVSGAVSGSIGQTEGTIYLDFSTIVGTNSNVIFALGDSGAGQNRLRILGNASRELRCIFQLNGNVTQYDFVRIGAVTSLTDFKIAIAYKSGDIAIAINGVLANTASSGLTFNGPLNSVELSAATVGFLTQRYRAVALYTTRLTNAELATLTTP
jgi:hypothetical protein